VVKVRWSAHGTHVREDDIVDGGTLAVGSPLTSYEGLLTGHPRKVVV
jgi:hypothetical protein